MKVAQIPCVLDVETGVEQEAVSLLQEHGDVVVPSNYHNEEAIKRYKDKAAEKQMKNAALDIDLAKVVALYWTLDGERYSGGTARTPDEEAKLLSSFWKSTLDTTYVGYNILDFDVPLLQRRSLYLNVPTRHVSVDRYRHPNIVDLMQELTYHGKIKARKLSFYVQRFEIKSDLKDPYTGSDVGTLILAKDWPAIANHCKADVEKEWRLAVRIGVIEPPVKDVDPTQDPF